MDPLAKSLKELGQEQFEPLQREAVEAILSGKSVLAAMPAASSRPATYRLAASLLPGATVVVTPRAANVKLQPHGSGEGEPSVAVINRHTSASEAGTVLAAVAAGQPKVLLLAPDQLRRREVQSGLREAAVSLLVVDEAQALSDRSPGFRPNYRLLRSFRESLGNPTTLALLVGPAAPPARRDIKTQLGIEDAAELALPLDRPNLSLVVRRLTAEPVKKQDLVLILRSLAADQSAVVFAPTIRGAEELAQELTQVLKTRVLSYHREQPTLARARTRALFVGGEAQVVVADSTGAELDRPDVRLVVHMVPPPSLEEYYQQITVAGRDGLPARSVLLYTQRDLTFRRWLLENGRARPDDVRDVLAAVQEERPLPGARPPVSRALPGRPLSGRPMPGRPMFGRPLRGKPLPGRPGRRGKLDRAESPESALPIPREEVAETKLRSILAELDLQGLVRRESGEPGKGSRLVVAEGANQREATLRADSDLDRLYRRRLANLAQVEAFLASGTCRREYLLKHFGEKLTGRPTPCCDRCHTVAEAQVLVGGMGKAPSVNRGAAKAEGIRAAAPPAQAGGDPLARIIRAGKTREESSVPWLLQQLEEGDAERTLAACTALGRIKDVRAEEPLRRLLEDPRLEVQQHAAEALGELGQTRATELALELLQASQTEGLLARTATQALARVRRRSKAAARGRAE